jgi:hypothetical protein
MMRFRVILASTALLALTLSVVGCFAGPDGLTSRNRAPEIVSLTVNGKETVSSPASPAGSASPSPSPVSNALELPSGQSIHFACTVRDADGDAMVIKWSPSTPSGATPSPVPTATPAARSRVTRVDPTPTPVPSLNSQNQYDWDAGATKGMVTITCTVSDDQGNTTSKPVNLTLK